MKKSADCRFIAVPLSLLVLALGNTVATAQTSQWLQEILLSRGFSPNPLSVDGYTTGTLSARRVLDQQQTPTGPCLGYISNTPDHILTLDSFFDYLSVTVESDKDTTLIVQGPGGIWCNDDSTGRNPAITGQWLEGTYQIWVGSYSPREQAVYTLRIRDIRPQANLKNAI
jgi:hypothetical protein